MWTYHELYTGASRSYGFSRRACWPTWEPALPSCSRLRKMWLITMKRLASWAVTSTCQAVWKLTMGVPRVSFLQQAIPTGTRACCSQFWPACFLGALEGALAVTRCLLFSGSFWVFVCESHWVLGPSLFWPQERASSAEKPFGVATIDELPECLS